MTPIMTFLARRILSYTLLVLMVITFSFIIVHMAPGDPSYVLAGEIADESFIKAVRERFGLDKPLYEQFLIYMYNVLRGDLGYSYLRGEPVVTLIVSRLPATLLLVLSAMLIASILGIILGALAAVKRGLIDATISILVVLGVSIPYFWLGQIMLLVFSIKLGLFPTSGMVDVRKTEAGLYYYLDILRHLTLPALTLAIFNLAYIAKISRGAFIEELTQDYTYVARALGFSERRIVLRYVLKGALIPVITFIGFNSGTLLVGAIVTETVYSWPGMGSLLYSSLKLRDYPVILGIFVYGSLIIIAISLIIDFLYMLLDPRIRRSVR